MINRKPTKKPLLSMPGFDVFVLICWGYEVKTKVHFHSSVLIYREGFDALHCSKEKVFICAPCVIKKYIVIHIITSQSRAETTRERKIIWRTHIHTHRGRHTHTVINLSVNIIHIIKKKYVYYYCYSKIYRFYLKKMKKKESIEPRFFFFQSSFSSILLSFFFLHE